MLVQVSCDGPQPFMAGLVFENDVCVQAAPILRRTCLGFHRDGLRQLFKTRGWKAAVVREFGDGCERP